jgi:predicted aspartyl protease
VGVRWTSFLAAIAACTNPNTTSPVTTPSLESGAQVTTVAPDAAPILDAWAKAAGGRERIAMLGALHGKGSYEKGGIVGTIELWQTPRGERRETVTLHVVTTTRVFDGSRGWLVDRNREVRELAGWEIDEQLALSFWGAHAALLTDRRPGAVTRQGDSLVLAPTGGKRPETVTFDRASKLPATRVRRDGERMRTTAVGDYNLVGGVELPFTMRETTDNPRDAVTIHWQTLEVATPPPGTFTRPADREPDMTLPASPVVVPIEVVYGGLVFAKVTINGTPLSFVVDTGAEATVLNASRLDKLGLSSIGSFATGAGGGDVVLSFVPQVTTQLGDAKVSDQIVVAIPLDHLERPLQRPLDGILGYDFLSRFVIELDYANQTMRIFDRSSYHHTGAGKPIAVTLEDGTPFIDAEIEVPNKGRIGGHFVLDTGCLCDVQLSTPFVDEHRLLSAFPHAKQAGFSSGAGGATNEMTATIPALHVGGEKIESPRADFARDTHGANADPESAGLIGSLTWKRFVLVLDYKHQQVFLDPAR